MAELKTLLLLALIAPCATAAPADPSAVVPEIELLERRATPHGAMAKGTELAQTLTGKGQMSSAPITPDIDGEGWKHANDDLTLCSSGICHVPGQKPTRYRMNGTIAEIEPGTKSIGYAAFRRKVPGSRYGYYLDEEITGVVIPHSVKKIYNEAFMNTRLTAVTVPDSVEEIFGRAFYNTPLETLSLGKSVQEIGDFAFANTPRDQPGSNRERESKLTKVTVPDSVTKIGRGAFGWNYGLTTVSIGKSVKEVGPEAFTHTKLSAVTVPDSVEKIGWNAFADTPLKKVSIGKSVKTIEQGAFMKTSLTAVTIPDSVEEIGEGAFHYTLLKTLSLGKSVKKISKLCFSATALTEVTIPDSVEEIDESAFADDQSLKKVSIGKSVKKIHKEAFGHTSLKGDICVPFGCEVADDAFKPYAIGTVC